MSRSPRLARLGGGWLALALSGLAAGCTPVAPSRPVALALLAADPPAQEVMAGQWDGRFRELPGGGVPLPSSRPAWVRLAPDPGWRKDGSSVVVLPRAYSRLRRGTLYLPGAAAPLTLDLFAGCVPESFGCGGYVAQLSGPGHAGESLYLRVEEAGWQELRPRWISLAAYRAEDLSRERLAAAVRATIAFILVVSLFVWWRLREPVFLLYLASVGGALLYFLLRDGRLYGWGGGQLLAGLGLRGIWITILLSAVAIIAFARNLGEVRERAPGWDLALRLWVAGLTLLTAVVLLHPASWHRSVAVAVAASVVVQALLVLLAAAVSWLRGSPWAAHFLVGWIPFAAIGAALALEAAGLFALPPALDSLHEATAAFQAGVFALALADRAVRYRRERDAALGLAQRDPLTGLLNRRGLEEALSRTFRRASLDGEPLAVVFADLDHFKHVNDRHGHHVGDDCLRMVAEVLLREVRAADLVGRYGGEELMVLLPRTEAETAEEIAERIRRRVEATPIPGVLPADYLTISLGVASLGPAISTVQELVDRADAALYEAKGTGRNRVVRLAAAEAGAGARRMGAGPRASP